MNDISQNKDNVKVIIRVRPKNEKEKEIFTNVKVEDSSIYVINTNKYYKFDYIADEESTQEDLFWAGPSEIAESALNGYNGTIFVYGQTGAGKTYTLLGKNNEIENKKRTNRERMNDSSDIDESYNDEEISITELSGILPRTIDFLFKKIKNEYKSNLITVKCSFLEIYNENLYDLLANEVNNNATSSNSSASFNLNSSYNQSNIGCNPSNSKNLIIRDQGDSVKVENLSLHTITNSKSALNLLNQGLKYRATAPTACNKESSRSHAVFSIHVENKFKFNNKKITKRSVFHLIDLAGSERQKYTETTGERTKEAGKINKSLMNLGHVIKSLVENAEGKKNHIHFRDSKLTHLLKDSLGGNSKTCIIANISSVITSSQETLSTLQFAQSAKQIKNKAIVNEEIYNENFYKEEIKKLADQYEKIKQEHKLLLSMVKEGKLNTIQNGAVCNINLNESGVFSTNQIETLGKQLQVLEEEAGLKDNKISDLIEENSFLRERIERLDIDYKLLKLEKRDEEKKSMEISEEIRRIKEEYQKEQLLRLKINEEKEDLKQALLKKESKLKLELNESQEKINELERKMINKDKEIRKLKEELNINEQENREKTEKIVVLNEMIIAKELKINEININIQKKENEIGNLIKELNNKEIENRVKEESLFNENLTLKNSMITKKQEIENLIISKESLSYQIKNLENELVKLKQTNKKHVDSIILLNNEKNKIEEKYFNENRLLQNKEREIQVLTSEKDILIEKHKVLEHSFDTINKEFNIFIENKSNSSKISNMISQKNKILQLESALEAKSKQITSMENFIKNLNLSSQSQSQSQSNITKAKNLPEIISDIEKRSNDLNQCRSIMHDYLLKIKNILDCNKEGFKISNLSENYIDGKSLEERFVFYMNEYEKYVGFIEKRLTSSNEELGYKGKKIDDLSKHIKRQSLVDSSLVIEDDNKNEGNGYKSSKSKIINQINNADLYDVKSLYKSINKFGMKRKIDNRENISNLSNISYKKTYSGCSSSSKSENITMKEKTEKEKEIYNGYDERVNQDEKQNGKKNINAFSL